MLFFANSLGKQVLRKIEHWLMLFSSDSLITVTVCSWWNY